VRRGPGRAAHAADPEACACSGSAVQCTARRAPSSCNMLGQLCALGLALAAAAAGEGLGGHWGTTATLAGPPTRLCCLQASPFSLFAKELPPITPPRNLWDTSQAFGSWPGQPGLSPGPLALAYVLPRGAGCAGPPAAGPPPCSLLALLPAPCSSRRPERPAALPQARDARGGGPRSRAGRRRRRRRHWAEARRIRRPVLPVSVQRRAARGGRAGRRAAAVAALAQAGAGRGGTRPAEDRRAQPYAVMQRAARVRRQLRRHGAAGRARAGAQRGPAPLRAVVDVHHWRPEFEIPARAPPPHGTARLRSCAAAPGCAPAAGAGARVPMQLAPARCMPFCAHHAARAPHFFICPPAHLLLRAQAQTDAAVGGASSAHGGGDAAVQGWPAGTRNPRAQRRRSLQFYEDGDYDDEGGGAAPAPPRPATAPRSHSGSRGAAAPPPRGASRPASAERAPSARMVATAGGRATLGFGGAGGDARAEPPARPASTGQGARGALARAEPGPGPGFSGRPACRAGAPDGALPAYLAALVPGGAGGSARAAAAAAAAAAAMAGSAGTPPVARRLSQASTGAALLLAPRSSLSCASQTPPSVILPRRAKRSAGCRVRREAACGRADSAVACASKRACLCSGRRAARGHRRAAAHARRCSRPRAAAERARRAGGNSGRCARGRGRRQRRVRQGPRARGPATHRAPALTLRCAWRAALAPTAALCAFRHDPPGRMHGAVMRVPVSVLRHAFYLRRVAHSMRCTVHPAPRRGCVHRPADGARARAAGRPSGATARSRAASSCTATASPRGSSAAAAPAKIARTRPRTGARRALCGEAGAPSTAGRLREPRALHGLQLCVHSLYPYTTASRTRLHRMRAQACEQTARGMPAPATC